MLTGDDAGGELGYALAVSFGAALDNPDLIVTCLVGGNDLCKRQGNGASGRVLMRLL